ncbi:beta-glucan synthesis-associated protein-domain-containing protein [Collybia nuda]|uniref:Beta-glucan synthesis-associated protein-domain-containing protein n=1 Tax=Collybia nuda TaxID=64659 RepID=A0A9P5Y6L3_9AGAR|nr:beta-glucan synthesis-associated protein-domain-containing protein [Collybia nuda]
MVRHHLGERGSNYSPLAFIVAKCPQQRSGGGKIIPFIIHPHHSFQGVEFSSMASFGHGSERQYPPKSNINPSATSLLPSRSFSNGTTVQAKFAQGPPSLRTMASNSSMNASPYNVSAAQGRNIPSIVPSISDKFSLSPDPAVWGSAVSLGQQEPDDDLHNPDPRRDRENDFGSNIFTYRGLTNLGCIFILGLGLIALFAGYPLISHFTERPLSTFGGFNIGGINATGQVPDLPGNRGLIDLDTPQSAYTKVSYTDPKKTLQLVFSDEFNTDGRSFYPGDDPYWEAVDLHYWATNNIEWYDPGAVATKDGNLEVTLSRKKTHGLEYEGGMVTSWNKFCFTGGLIEASVMLPGANNIAGLWPAIWTLGNLGRAGYGASLDGLWPYTYDECDVGTVANQTLNGVPATSTINGDGQHGGALSFLPGQRLSRCTCPGEAHPGPMHSDGTYVGRSAPEIDIFEAQVAGVPLTGHVSQSSQFAPFNDRYIWFNDTMIITDPSKTAINAYRGAAYQQSTSGLSHTNQDCYELETGCFTDYGFEYKPGFDDAYVTWISQGQADWTLLSSGVAADPIAQISARPIPQEPMYIIMNLGMSENFGDVDLEHLTFPTKMKVDWIRVYQPQDAINIGCDPKEFPTKAYIEHYLPAYTNPNLTTWVDDFKQTFPKNRFLGEC